MMIETREAFAVIGNKDTSQGSGLEYVKAYCDTQATAERMGNKGYVQGTNCPIEVHTLHRVAKGSPWLGPVEIYLPSPEDFKRQTVLDERTEALEIARGAGLTDRQIDLLKST